MPSPTKVPMVCIDFIGRNVEQPVRLREIATEYWTPTQPWEIYEFLDRTMTVVALIQSPDTIATSAARMAYQNDRDLAKRLWP